MPAQTAAFSENTHMSSDGVSGGHGKSYYGDSRSGLAGKFTVDLEMKDYDRKRNFQDDHVKGWQANKGQHIGSKRGKFRSANFGF